VGAISEADVTVLLNESCCQHFCHAYSPSKEKAMLRLIRSLIFLPMACATLAATSPKDGWERPLDPDNDCKIDIKDGTVTMELPGTYHEFNLKRKCFNAPRLLRDVEGNFVVQVRVSTSSRPSVKSSVDRMQPRVAAGLLLIATDEDYIRLESECYRRTEEQRRPDKGKRKEEQPRKPELRSGPAFKLFGTQTQEVELEPPWEQDRQAKEERIYLRFERKGNGFREAISPDGKTWTTHVSMTGFLNLPRKLKVGLAAYSTSTEPFKVRFDQFKLIRGGEKNK
jgi:regulation of enolase protein 1 (concanavalin A-like superfamily)